MRRQEANEINIQNSNLSKEINFMVQFDGNFNINILRMFRERNEKIILIQNEEIISFHKKRCKIRTDGYEKNELEVWKVRNVL